MAAGPQQGVKAICKLGGARELVFELGGRAEDPAARGKHGGARARVGRPQLELVAAAEARLQEEQ